MSAIIDQALDKITHYQSSYTEEDKQYWIAEQIKDICRESYTNAEHLFNDIDGEKMSLAEVEKKSPLTQEHTADAHRRKLRTKLSVSFSVWPSLQKSQNRRRLPESSVWKTLCEEGSVWI